MHRRRVSDAVQSVASATFTVFIIYHQFNNHEQFQNGKLEVVPLDYQSFHLGTLAADLIAFIWIGSDTQFRKHYYKQIIEHYYTELTHALQNLRVDINKVYPRKVFEQELEEVNVN